MTSASAWTIQGKYTIHPDQPRRVGGQPGFAASAPHAAAALALTVQRGLPPRQHAIETLRATPVPGLLNPLAHGAGPSPHGAGEQDYFVLCEDPPGPAIDAARPWTESELIDCLLRPAAAVLSRLQALGLTHRAIRPDNVFQPAPGEPVVLGQAWAAPPASLQPAASEPPYSAICPPAGRGDGSIADDVYALGVLIVMLAAGTSRIDRMAPDEILRAKLDLGSFDALAGDARLPSLIADLARGMLAEDPDHRPAPTLLLDPASARARRLAARPPRRAAAPIRVGATIAWTARAAAHAIATQPEGGSTVLQTGAIDTWLRRSLGDPGLAARLDEALHGPAALAGAGESTDAIGLMRAVAVLDPLAPLCWRGLSLWPGGIGPALASAAADQAAQITGSLVELIQTEAIGTWAAQRPERCGVAELVGEARQLRALVGMGRSGGQRRTSGAAVAERRMLYALNPLLPCASPLLGGRCVTRVPDLLPALEASVASAGKAAPDSFIDAEIAAFLAARSDRSHQADLTLSARGGESAALAQLDLLARLQARGGGPAPALARRIAESKDQLLNGWVGESQRAHLAAELARLAEEGLLGAMSALLRNPVARAQDEAGAKAAARRLVQVDAELARLENGQGVGGQARGLGQEIAAGLGLAALAASLIAGLVG